MFSILFVTYNNLLSTRTVEDAGPYNKNSTLRYIITLCGAQHIEFCDTQNISNREAIYRVAERNISRDEVAYCVIPSGANHRCKLITAIYVSPLLLRSFVVYSV